MDNHGKERMLEVERRRSTRMHSGELSSEEAMYCTCRKEDYVMITANNTANYYYYYDYCYYYYYFSSSSSSSSYHYYSYSYSFFPSPSSSSSSTYYPFSSSSSSYSSSSSSSSSYYYYLSPGKYLVYQRLIIRIPRG